jgi:hypothetical protein
MRRGEICKRFETTYEILFFRIGILADWIAGKRHEADKRD